jgi:hypothetical protein
MTKNAWFKHYNTASEGNSIALLLAEEKYEVIVFWWWLLEKISLWEKKEKRGTITLNSRILKREFGWNLSRTSRILNSISTHFGANLNPISPNSWEVCLPNWLEFQDFKMESKSKSKIESKNKIKREKINDDAVLLVDQILINKWEEIYKDRAWIDAEQQKARAWLAANPDRKIKNFGRFMTNWLNKGWNGRSAEQIADARHDEICREIFLAKPPREGLV